MKMQRKTRKWLKSKMRNSKAITLIALVVTIVVLLILAGVSINMLAGENGIIKQAQKARDESKKSEIDEKIKLSVQAAYANSVGGEIEQTKFKEELDTNFGSGEASLDYDENTKIYTVTVDDYEIEVSNTGEVGEITKSSISIKFILSHTEQVPTVGGNVKELTGENVPIPTGFYYVGGTKNTGVVISDVENDDMDNTAKGNQFVWVPVNQNQKLTLDVTSEEEITGIKLTGPDGTETTLTASGKTFNQEITMTKNGVYIVEVTTATATKIASKRIMSLYAQDVEMGVIMNTNAFKNNATEKYNTKSELLVAKGYDTLDDLLAGEGASSLVEYMGSKMIYITEGEKDIKGYLRTSSGNSYTDNNQNTDSVNKYGGFYIARYEAGDGTTASARTTSTADTNMLVSKKGAYVYNWIACEDSTQEGDAIRLSSGMYSSNPAVTSQLITGAGWDRTLNWIIETGGKTENEVIIDSRSWGNYKNSTGNAKEYSGSSNMNCTTGRSEYWKANNIYDLAGNESEWTQEKKGTNCVNIGGSYNGNGDISPASNRGYYGPTYQDYKFVSFRVQLYINV